MPTLIRFLVIVGLIGGAGYASMYVLAEYFEPKAETVTKPVPGVKIRR